MRTLLVKIIQILDGTPAVYGQRQKGQSVVELALVTPILIILLAGLVEIGWFANNYLTLLDVSRAGARRGTVLQDQQSPLFWDNNGSRLSRDQLPISPLNDPYYTDLDMPAGETEATRNQYRWSPTNVSACADPSNRMFYNEVICTMIASLDPLDLNPENGIDDIIVSGFSLANVDASIQSRWLGVRGTHPRPVDDDIPQLVVAGRYPTNANECDVLWDGVGTPTVTALEPRDPFDFNYSGGRDLNDADTAVSFDGTNDFTELDGFDPVGATWQSAEKQRGFSLFGNHRIPGTACTGSAWSMADMEALMNLQQFPVPVPPSDPNYRTALIETRRLIPPQGVVLVELFWQHELLLRFPLLAPVYTALGSERTTISVWAAFPLPSVEPYIEFDGTP